MENSMEVQQKKKKLQTELPYDLAIPANPTAGFVRRGHLQAEVLVRGEIWAQRCTEVSPHEDLGRR